MPKPAANFNSRHVPRAVAYLKRHQPTIPVYPVLEIGLKNDTGFSIGDGNDFLAYLAYIGGTSRIDRRNVALAHAALSVAVKQKLYICTAESGESGGLIYKPKPPK